MHLHKTVCILLPALAHAMPDVAAVEVVTPTMTELQAFYPDVAFDNMVDDLSFNETYHVDSADQATRYGYKFIAAGLSMIGYFSLGGGCEQYLAAKKSCKDPNGDGDECWERATATALAHILVGGAGFVGGRQFIMYFWHGGALQAAGLPAPGQRFKRACNTDQSTYTSSIHFSGQYGLKIAGKNMHCYNPDAGQLGYVSSFGSMIEAKMNTLNSNGMCTLSTQFTIYKTSTNTVLGRYHLESDSVRTDVCPFEITGGDSCIVST